METQHAREPYPSGTSDVKVATIPSYPTKWKRAIWKDCFVLHSVAAKWS